MTRGDKLAVVVGVVVGAGLMLQALRSSSAEAASPAGVSLARDWALDEVTAQPVGGYITYGQGDRRYCRLTGCTMTGQLVVNKSGSAISLPTANSYIELAAGPRIVGVSSSRLDFYATTSINMSNSVGGPLGTGLNVLGAITAQGGSVQTDLALASTRGAAAGVILSGTGWYEDDGDTAANIITRTPTAGRGSFKYDDTNARWRDYENGNWNYRITANPDGGTPYGPLHYWTAYNGVTTASTRKLTAISARERTRIMGVSFVPTTVGVGAGTFNIEVRDITGAVSLCTSGNISCTSAVGTMSETACAAIDVTATNQLAVQIICGGCGTCPLGNATAVMQQL